jgi:adenylate kinase family enzyme
MQRVIVVGATGSGKSTLASRVARALDMPHIELDALFWGPNWTRYPVDEFRDRVSAALSGECWVADGNYSKARDIVWERADTLVWLDLPLPLTFSRVVRRAIRRITTQEDLWGTGNRESWRGIFFSRDSLLVWALETHGRYQWLYPQLMQQPEYAHLTVYRLRSRQAIAEWLDHIEQMREHSDV